MVEKNGKFKVTLGKKIISCLENIPKAYPAISLNIGHMPLLAILLNTPEKATE